jgi:hypothetical protein
MPAAASAAADLDDYVGFPGPTFFGYDHPTNAALISQWAVSSVGMILVFEGALRFTKAGKSVPVQKNFPPQQRLILYTASSAVGWMMGKYCLPPPAPLTKKPVADVTPPRK